MVTRPISAKMPLYLDDSSNCVHIARDEMARSYFEFEILGYVTFSSMDRENKLRARLTAVRLANEVLSYSLM